MTTMTVIMIMLLSQLLLISQTHAYASSSLRIPSPIRRSHVRCSDNKATSARSSMSLFQFKNFDEMLEKVELPILVDFYAEWCGPCKMMVPVLEQLAASMEGEAMIAKVDTDKSPKLASRFSIEALPTLILFYKGKPVETFQGYLPADQLEVKVRQVISRIKQAGV